MRTADAGSCVARARGALLGLACGDAIGATVEFMPRGGFAPLADGGGHPYTGINDSTVRCYVARDNLASQWGCLTLIFVLVRVHKENKSRR